MLGDCVANDRANRILVLPLLEVWRRGHGAFARES
jgi:hypothetical protein